MSIREDTHSRRLCSGVRLSGERRKGADSGTAAQATPVDVAVIHGFWPKDRVRNEAGVYVVLEQRGIAPLGGLEGFWSRVYEEGLEDGLTGLIAEDIDRLARILKIVEVHRATIYR